MAQFMCDYKRISSSLYEQGVKISWQGIQKSTELFDLNPSETKWWAFNFSLYSESKNDECGKANLADDGVHSQTELTEHSSGCPEIHMFV